MAALDRQVAMGRKMSPPELNEVLRQAVRFLRRGGVHRAVRRLKRLISHKDFSGRALAYYNLGIALERLESYREALSCYQRAAMLDPTLVDAVVCQGIVYGRLGDDRRELRCYDEVLRRFPHHPIALYNKGVVMDDRLGDVRGAIRWYLRCFQTPLGRQQRRDIYLRLCHAYLSLRQYRSAERYLKKLMNSK